MARSLQEVLEVPGVLEELRQHPETFRFRDGPNLRVMTVQSSPDLDIITHGGRDSFVGPLKNLLDLLSHSLNFTYTITQPPDDRWGGKLPNGTWNGLIGAAIRNETDLVLGLMSMSRERKGVVDFCYQIEVGELVLVARKGSLEVDPWAFLSVLSLSTWLLLFLALLASGTALVVLGLSRWARGRYPFSQAVLMDLLRILVQQEMRSSPHSWQRCILGSWLLLTTVLVWAYCSTVTSAFAVRFASRPVHSVRDVFADDRLDVVMAEATVYTDNIEREETEVFKMLAELKRQGRLIYQPLPFRIGQGDYVFLQHGASADFEIAEEYLKSGKCEFYKGKERLLYLPESLVLPKGSPLIHAINHRLRRLEMSGIFSKWRKDAFPLLSRCSYSPEKILVKESLKYSSIRGMLLLLASGLTAALVVFFLELKVARITIHQTITNST